MGVFNATANQVLISPVTEYYRGQAIRQEQADKEQMSELRGLQIEEARMGIENAPEDRKRAKQMQDLMREQVEQEIAAGNRDSLAFSAALLQPWVEQYKKDGNIEKFNQGIQSTVLPNMGKKEQEEFAEIYGRDLDENEVDSVDTFLNTFRQVDDADVPTLQNFADAEGNIIASYPEGSPEYYEAVADPNLFAAGNVSQTQKTRDLTAEELNAEAEEKAQIAQELRAGMRAYQRTPGAGGMGGWISEKLGGIAGALTTLLERMRHGSRSISFRSIEYGRRTTG